MGVVSILTHSFTDGYNRDFSRVFGGGLERYILDLCSVILGLGHIPEVHQLSYFGAFQARTGWRAERERLGIYARETALSYDISHWRCRWSTVLESFLAEAGLKEGIRG
ncbi:hypothetical protein JNUCC31_12725 [Paenibacillus sp. JNUCC31]|uniref:hypothetical protein n=1 Tax=Paenibacillus sp. JNUCC-31 TaxID=2777983 RepID=UPI00177E93AD|nr:hypothetical protein [Paenibacillus sp. JNUCC-31]QOS81631.1 hypothetical protein JNUCC31_12725 [Paenibacillus sp. JNUCC-31]